MVGRTPFLTAAGSEDIAVASTAVVYTRAIRLLFGEYFSLKYKAVSATGSPSVKIEFEESDRAPETEGAADAHYVEPESLNDIEADLTSETWHIKSFSPPVAIYGRLKITGSGSNPADTIVNAMLMMADSD